MNSNSTNIALAKKLKLIFCFVLLEYLVFIYSGVSFSFLHGDSFFSIGTDPVFWAFYLARFPQFIAANQWLGILLDISIPILLLLLIINPFNHKAARIVFFLLLLFYIMLMGYKAHRNYQVGFALLFFPFIFRKEINKSFAFEAIRYFLLFFYVSAAVLKIWSHAFADHALFSHLITSQFTPYFLEGNTGLRTNANLFLIGHPIVTQVLYNASIVIEFAAILGFFTKRFDKSIAIVVLLFHFCNWFIMDIAPLGQISFICLLFVSNEMKLQSTP
jgi:hypothetical protein